MKSGILPGERGSRSEAALDQMVAAQVMIGASR
jgi:hypothetical protein